MNASRQLALFAQRCDHDFGFLRLERELAGFIDGVIDQRFLTLEGFQTDPYIREHCIEASEPLLRLCHPLPTFLDRSRQVIRLLRVLANCLESLPRVIDLLPGRGDRPYVFSGVFSRLEELGELAANGVYPFLPRRECVHGPSNTLLHLLHVRELLFELGNPLVGEPQIADAGFELLREFSDLGRLCRGGGDRGREFASPFFEVLRIPGNVLA